MAAKGCMETEVKFRIDSPEKMAGRLKSAGAEFVTSGFETNMKLGKKGVNDEDEKLKLRLRSFGDETTITHKEKPENEPDGFKVREETEITADNFGNAKKLLDRLGFVPKWTYEKKKQVWKLGDAEIDINVIPMLGSFLEIEASRETIRKVARKLGFDMKDVITDSYGDMDRNYRKAGNLPRQDLTFPEGEKRS